MEKKIHGPNIKWIAKRNSQKHRQNSHLIIHCPTSEGVSEASERANKWAQRSARAKQAVRSKLCEASCAKRAVQSELCKACEQVSGASERANGRASGPVSGFVVTLDHSAMVGEWFLTEICGRVGHRERDSATGKWKLPTFVELSPRICLLHVLSSQVGWQEIRKLFLSDIFSYTITLNMRKKSIRNGGKGGISEVLNIFRLNTKRS